MNPLPLPQTPNQQAALAVPFAQIAAADLPIVGGKGANLGELTRAGFAVPAGFCVTTTAFRLFLSNYEELDQLYELLDTIPAGDLEMARQVGEQVRARLQLVPIPAEVAAEVVAAWQTLGSDDAYAVRSSATAEDLPDASFAGQQDTYLNVRGEQALLEAVRRCWISLYTDRAIMYRQQNNFNHRDVLLSVVVQRMVRPEVSGILFTADPVSGHRGIVSIDASFGLGEALVSGLVSADLYQVDPARQTLLKRQIADKQMAIRPLPNGGVEHVALSAEERVSAVLTDAQALELATLGKQIEAHYGKPQDIEWALENEHVYVLQARPITSLFPLPQPQPHDDTLHVYLSFSHAQVMTDPMPELSLSIWRMVFPFGRPAGATENPAVCSAAGRVFLDVSPALRNPVMKRVLPGIITNMLDALMGQALHKVSGRADLQRQGARLSTITLASKLLPVVGRLIPRLVWTAPEGMAGKVLRQMQPYLDNVEQRLVTAPTEGARLREASQILQTAFGELVWRLLPYAMTGLIASRLLERVTTSFASHDDITAVMRGLQGNVTTDMDLAVGDLADLVRQSPALAQHLAQPQRNAAELLATADAVADSTAFLAAWHQFLAQYGMRGPSEIDISRSRWHEDPTSLLYMILGNTQQSEAGAHRTHFARMEREGLAAAARLVEKAQQGKLGWLRGRVVQRLARVTRELLPMREHHKFVIVQMLGLVKKAVVEAAELLVAQQRIDQIDDVWFLSLPELIAAVDDSEQDVRTRISSRRAEFARFQTMTPPRVMTSEGEMIIAEHAAVDAPENSLVGSPVSTGVVEGIARVVLNPQTEIVRAGEILVAPFTDPGWTPLFINAAGLVTEVGGLMTHGSLVAREYGIPAVVGVKDATKRIKTGQRIRVHGDGGYVELLDNVDTDSTKAVLTPALSMV